MKMQATRLLLWLWLIVLSFPAVSSTSTIGKSNLWLPGVGLVNFNGKEQLVRDGDRIWRSKTDYVRIDWADVLDSSYMVSETKVLAVLKRMHTPGNALTVRLMNFGFPNALQGLVATEWEKEYSSTGVLSFPNYQSPELLKLHGTIVEQLASILSRLPEFMMIEVGSIGCWGEWNAECCPPAIRRSCRSQLPSAEIANKYIQDYVTSFGADRLILVNGVSDLGGRLESTMYFGWRGDCADDVRDFNKGRSHAIDIYSTFGLKSRSLSPSPVVILEPCGGIGRWQEYWPWIDLLVAQNAALRPALMNWASAAVDLGSSPWLRPLVDSIGTVIRVSYVGCHSGGDENGFVMEYVLVSRGPAEYPRPLSIDLIDEHLSKRSETSVVGIL